MYEVYVLLYLCVCDIEENGFWSKEFNVFVLV